MDKQVPSFGVQAACPVQGPISEGPETPENISALQSEACLHTIIQNNFQVSDPQSLSWLQLFK